MLSNKDNIAVYLIKSYNAELLEIVMLCTEDKLYKLVYCCLLYIEFLTTEDSSDVYWRLYVNLLKIALNY